MTNTAKHTPGPWTYNAMTNSIYDNIGKQLCLMCQAYEYSHDEQQATAKLITAAPDMAEALKRIMHPADWPNRTDFRPEDLEFARAALAKAGVE